MGAILQLPMNREDDGFLRPVDVSGSNAYVGIVNTPGTYSESTYQYGNAAWQFTGAGGLSISLPGFNIADSDFTVQFWFNFSGSGTNYQRLVQFGPNITNGGLWLLANATSDQCKPWWQGNVSGSYFNAASSVTDTIASDTWHHFAFVRNASDWTTWINGEAWQTISRDSYTMVENTLYLGCNSSGSEAFSGFMDDLKISLTAEYTEAFTPPSAWDYTPISPALDVMERVLHRPGAPVLTPSVRGLDLDFGPAAHDIYYGGTGVISGTTRVKSSPSNIAVSRRVRLYEKRSGILVRETWSDTDGSYTFRHLNTGYAYYATTFDYTNTYEAVSADNLTAS